MMKEIYIDIMEKALSAYTDERIQEYINEIKERGLTEHGFGRLTANIGILIAFGRRTDLTDKFIVMMDICCRQMPRTKKCANDFTIREICFCLMLLQEKQAINQEKLDEWRFKLASFNPLKYYDVVPPKPNMILHNWAAFAALSDFIRGKFCGKNTNRFVDLELSTQMRNFDANGMYKDPHNPMVYDLVGRVLMCGLLHFGYKGKYRALIEENVLKSADITAKMQSVTGEIPFGGRSNQFLHNETHLACFCEYFATYFAQQGNMQKAGEFKTSANLAIECILHWLEARPISHIKNKYDRDSKIGCERYGYFNKYMITVASFAYFAYLLADDSIEPQTAVTQKGGYVAVTSEDFHKIFLNAGNYFVEWETKADFNHDANGIGRIHKKGCHSALCLSVPFPAGETLHKVEKENKMPMSLCGFIKKENVYFYGSEECLHYELLNVKETPEKAEIDLKCSFSDNICFNQSCSVSKDGVELTVNSDCDCGFMVPVFTFDGHEETKITEETNCITVKYAGSECKYIFNGKIGAERTVYYNRNGRYVVYRINSKKLKVEMK